MTEVQTRRTDRILLEINILASGTDIEGKDFREITRTLSISRYGARLAINQKLATGQELSIRNITSGVEADFRVVGQMGEGPEGIYYGIESLDPEVNLWGIHFPPISAAEAAAGRALVECVRCHSQQLVYLDESELEVFESSHVIVRPCVQCASHRLWKRPTDKMSAISWPSPVRGKSFPQSTELPPEKRQDERQSARINLQVEVCIRTREHGDDIVTTQDVSHGGFRCKSTQWYGTGVLVVEVCVPYSAEAGKIFSLARIAHAEPLPNGKEYSYGLAHLHMHKRQAEN